MPAATTYSKEYIDQRRSRVKMQLSAYTALLHNARRSAGTARNTLTPAVRQFEPLFFNNMVLALDNMFANRSRTVEQRDGNPINEIRLLCESILYNEGTFTASKAIRYKPDDSVLKYRIGDTIHLSKEDFSSLADAFFDEIERRYLVGADGAKSKVVAPKSGSVTESLASSLG